MALSRSANWQAVVAERERLAADLAAVTDQQWSTPSLCPGWSVQHVVAHLIDAAETGKASFVMGMVRARGDFDAANEHGIRRCWRDDPQEQLAALRAVTGLRRTPPANRATRLVEAIVHGEDIRRPLGNVGQYPSEAVLDALRHQLRTRVSFGGGRERAEGLRLVDAESGESWGQGPVVQGSALDLLLAASGRPVAAARFTGAGADEFAERLMRAS